MKDFEISMSRELEGIGALLTTDDGCTVVKHIVPGGIADKNGQLKADDKIIGVGQDENGAMADVTDMKLRKVVELIRGKPGTTVRLDVISGDETQRKIIRLVRQKIELKDSTAKVFDAGRKPDGVPYRIGVIDLPSFYRDMENRRGVADFKSATRDVRGSSRIFAARTWTRWSSTCATMAAARSPRPSALRACSSARAGGPNQRLRRPRGITRTATSPAWPGPDRWWS